MSPNKEHEEQSANIYMSMQHLRSFIISYELNTDEGRAQGCFRKGLAHYPSAKPNGSDIWAFRELKALPADCRSRLDSVVHEAHSQVANPIQNLLNIHPLLGKPSGGERTICKTPAFYRIMLRGSSTVPQWEKR